MSLQSFTPDITPLIPDAPLLYPDGWFSADLTPAIRLEFLNEDSDLGPLQSDSDLGALVGGNDLGPL